ncbi:MFS transporter [Cupriavidus consociatus]|uniref:MFS transporter n=1 Tax=Cupriavidus consociatus TaxID=2821357 RepID=UPI001AE47AFD|nr:MULTISPECIES: MFS transporter [unclassified Cupriavidus]MBP0623358.1 MFS transporter [Cupriavidus sp. LEh25]MDK2660055.1 MFS transporter [Cupriavidus sp. LEh21]
MPEIDAGKLESAIYDTARGNLARLTIAQALGGANGAVVYSTGAIVGHMLTPTPALATLPISIFVVGMAIATLPVGLVAQRHGRRMAFMVGTGCGILVGVLAALAVLRGSFWMFCAAMLFGGAYAAVVLSFRFAAADCVPPERRPRALSFVMAGGVFAGVIGPQLVTHTMNLWAPHSFAATYLAQAAVAAMSAVLLTGIRLPPSTADSSSSGRAIRVIARQPWFIAAVICGVVSYLVMNFLMTAAPLAMQLCGLSQESSNLGIQWHVMAMFAPGFFTGRLVTRFGAPRVATTGLVLTSVSAAVGLTGVDVAYFWLTLVLLGVGWNFGFIGATAMVLECHRTEEKARVQSFNDFVVFGAMALGSFLSGSLLTAYGWKTVLWLSFVPLLLAIGALMLASTRRSKLSGEAVNM